MQNKNINFEILEPFREFLISEKLQSLTRAINYYENLNDPEYRQNHGSHYDALMKKY